MILRGTTGFLRQYSSEMKRPVGPAPLRPEWKLWPETGLHAAWIGHSTVLIKVDGQFILTDPIFSRHAGLNLGPVTLGVKRIVAPALALRELPKIDAIVLSHAHMDHFDVPSLRALKNPNTTVFTAAKTADLLRASRYKAVHELAWGETKLAAGIAVRAFEVNHWGARVRTDLYRGYNGYLIESGRYRILFGGDTAMTASFRTLRSAGRIDLGIMPIGAYNPWVRFHCTPEQAWEMGNDAGAELLIPIHHKTFHLSREPYHEPIERYLAAAGGNADRVVVREIGGSVSV